MFEQLVILKFHTLPSLACLAIILLMCPLISFHGNGPMYSTVLFLVYIHRISVTVIRPLFLKYASN